MEAKNWNLEVDFRVFPSREKKVFGDGFAIWLTKECCGVGSIFGSVDFFKGVGIFFDTFDSLQHHVLFFSFRNNRK